MDIYEWFTTKKGEVMDNNEEENCECGCYDPSVDFALYIQALQTASWLLKGHGAADDNGIDAVFALAERIMDFAFGDADVDAADSKD